MLKRMCRSCCVRPVLPLRSAFAGFRFPREVIVLAVRWYLRYGLSYRDVEELLAERGVQVDHVSVFRWVQRFTPLLAEGHCCIEAKGVLVMHQSSEADPSGTLENRNKPGIRRHAT
jgi:hypothetical protein